MADTVHKNVTPFHLLLGTISSQILAKDVCKIKVYLQGHVNKEAISSLASGEDIINILYKRSIVTDKKIAFLRGLLVECGLVEQVYLLDEYRKTTEDTQSRQESSRAVRKRLQELRCVIERQQDEIKNHEQAGKELNDMLTEKEMLLDSHKETCISQHEMVESLNDKLSAAVIDRELFEERAQESQEIINIQEEELKNLQDILKKSRLNLKKTNPVRVSVFEKLSNDKSKTSLESIMKQKEDKTETLRKYKESNENTLNNLFSQRENVRRYNLQILEGTKKLIAIDEEHLQTYEEMRKIRQQYLQNEVNVWDIKAELDDTLYEYQKTEKGQIVIRTAISTIPTDRLREPTKQKVLNYKEVLQGNAYYLGCYGNKVDSLQLDSPSGVTATRDDVIYVADRGDGRVHILDQLGNEIKDPITINNYRPLCIVISKKGNIITTDSKIVKVFTSDGLLSHNFLPVYSQKDRQPKISALAVDKEGHILAADIANHRIQKFHVDGHFMGIIGGPAFLTTPSGVAVTKYGDVIVSEYESHQLKVFHHHGKSFSTIGRQGIGKAQFMNPRGLAIDNKGNILVADTMNHRIQVIDMDGNYIASVGRLGSGLGCLDTPYSVAVNRRGHVFVADKGNHRITVFT